MNLEAKRLSEKHTKNARVLNDRFHILKHLPKNATVAEIGVLGGDWSNHIIQQTSPKELTLIDTFFADDYAHLNRFTKESHLVYINGKFESHGAKVQIKKGLSWDIMALEDDQKFDWIYIDAAHDYESVKKDLSEGFRCLKPNGYIVMNDYILYDHITNEAYGVIQATNEFMIENDFEMLFLALHPGMFCDIVIRKIQ